MKSIRYIALSFIALSVIIYHLCSPLESYSQTPIALGPDPAHLLVQERYLYWSDASSTPVNRVPVCGGASVPLVDRMGTPDNIAINGQYIYWTDSGLSLKRTSLDDSSTIEIAESSGNYLEYPDIVVDDANIYLVDSVTSPDIYTVKKVPLAGGPSTSLVSSSSYRIFGLADDATHIYWADDRFPDPDYYSSIKRTSKTTGITEVVASDLRAIRGGLAIHGGEIFFADSNYYDTLRLMKISVSGGDLTVLATITKDPFEPTNDVKAIAVDSENLYWADQKTLNAVPVSGGSIITLTTLSNEPLDIVLNADTIFWTETTGPAHGETGTIKSIPKSGGVETVLVQGGDAPRKLKLHNDLLFWTEGGPIGEIEGFGRIAKISIGGEMASTVIAGVSSNSPPIAVDSSYLYIADKWRIKKLPISGGIVQTLAVADDKIEDIAIDQTSIYWNENPISAVRKMPKRGGDVTTLTNHGTGWGPPGPIRVHNGYVYWMDHFDIIEKIPVGGGDIVTLASDLPFLNDFVVDDTSVYFSEHDTGALRKMSIDGGPISTLSYRSIFFSPRYLAQDTLYLYWIDQKEVGYISKNGGNPTLISSDVVANPFFSGSIDVDTTGIYWTETALGLIQKYSFGKLDTDGDCLPDSEDEFPVDPTEWLDTDNDGIGNNTDIDDDNDGIEDTDEYLLGFDPLDPSDPCSYANYYIVNSHFSALHSSDMDKVVFFDSSHSSCYEMVACVKEDRLCSKIWDFGGAGNIIGGNGADIVVFQYDEPGDYTTSLTMTEQDSGTTATENLTVTAETVQTPLPSIDFSTTVIADTVSLVVTDLDPTDAHITSLIVFWGDRNRDDYTGSLPATINHHYNRAGTDYRIRVKAFTDSGEFNYSYMDDENLTVNIP